MLDQCGLSSHPVVVSVPFRGVPSCSYYYSYTTDLLTLASRSSSCPLPVVVAPKLYNVVANALLWLLVHHDKVNGLHYLDDFLLFEDPYFRQGERFLHRALARCAMLGVPVASRKTEGPSTTLTFLGLELDTLSLTVQLPSVKLERLRREIRRWECMKSCSKRDLLSIIGQLQHACCAIKAGRSFLRRMIDLSKCVKELHHWIRLNAGFLLDLRWWGCFLPILNHSCPMTTLCRGTPQVALTSNASGSWGCGAFTSGESGSSCSFPRVRVTYTSLWRSCFPLFLRPRYGAVSGRASQYPVSVIMLLWWPLWTPVGARWTGPCT